MPTKTYTAQEMREMADYNDAAYARNPSLYSSAASKMLRYAAEVLERCDWLRWLLRNSRVTVYTKCGPVAFKDVRLGADGHEVIIDTEGSCPRLMECDRDTLHKMLREACIEMCHACPSCSGPGEDHGYRCVDKAGECFVQEWRVAVGMNGGEK